MAPRPDRPKRPAGGAPRGRPAGGAGGGRKAGKAGGAPPGKGGAPGASGRPARAKPGRPAAGGRRGDDRSGRAERPKAGGARGRGRDGDELAERDGRSTRPTGSGGRFRGREERPATKPEGRAGSWGGVARRGAGSGGSAAPVVRGRLDPEAPSRAAEAFRAATDAAEDVRVRRDDSSVRGAAAGAVRRGTAPEPARARPSRPKPAKVDTAGLADELGPVVGPNTAPRLAAKLADAGRAFQAERYNDAKRILAPMADRAPASAAVRELYGLTLYRLGKWVDAIRELEAFRSLSGATDQHPVLSDCYRALGRYDEVEALWRELREVSPSAELVAEGRIVHAGALADRGLVREAIADIEPAVKRLRKPQDHHLRLLYVLADLYERAGDLPRARSLFERLVAADPEFADAAARRRAL
jgi:hypothetical protein